VVKSKGGGVALVVGDDFKVSRIVDMKVVRLLRGLEGDAWRSILWKHGFKRIGLHNLVIL